MTGLELLLLAVVAYYLVYVLLWLLLDCNVRLWYNERYGRPVSQLRGKVVWITGASSGIGRGTALVLARHGVRLVLSARRQNLLEAVRGECLQAGDGLLTERDVLVLPMDMLQMEEHVNQLQKVIIHFGQLDVLLNNAGRSQRANWEDISVKVDRELFELDVFAAVHLSRLAVRHFIERCGGHGHIAATSSVAGLIPVPFSATYCAAKHALNAYLGALKVEQPQMDVTIFAPGPIATDFLLEAFTATPNEKVGGSTQDQKRMTAERCGWLLAIALANKMDLAWCGLFPVNFLAYVARYPALTKIAFHLLNQKMLKKIRDGKI